MKKCSRCGEFKSLADFGKRKESKDGLLGRCRECENRRNRARYPAGAPGESRDQGGPGPGNQDVSESLRDAARAFKSAREQRDLRQERNALLAENERLKSQIDQAKALREPPTLTVISKSHDPAGDAVPCVVFSDWHVEETVEKHKVHGINEFSLEIAKERSELAFQNALRLIEISARDSSVKTVWAGFLGDFFSNYIHEELREVNELAPRDAANFAKSLLASGVDFWLRESPYRFEIDCIHGNHGRMTLKPRIQNSAETSLESFMYDALAERYRDNPRVKFRVAQGKMLYRELFPKFRMRLLHGDDVKYGGGVGGITIPIRKKLAAWDKGIRADLTVMGHFHQRIDGGDFIVNGSLIGFNEFSLAIGASPEPPQQAFFLVHARDGGTKSIVAPIWVEDPKEEK